MYCRELLDMVTVETGIVRGLKMAAQNYGCTGRREEGGWDWVQVMGPLEKRKWAEVEEKDSE